MVKSWQIRPSTFFLLAFVLTIVLIPLPGPGLLVPFVSIPIFLGMRKKGQIKDFELIDIPLIITYAIGAIIGMLYLQAITLVSIPWWKLLVVGIACDVVASILGAVPVLGDAASGFVNIIIALTIIGGVEGAILGMVIMFISLLPGPSLGANTLFLVIFKGISEAIIGG